MTLDIAQWFQDPLTGIYIVVSICELAITLALFYTEHKLKILDEDVDERLFHLNNILLSHQMIQQLKAAEISITPALLENSRRSINFLFPAAPDMMDLGSYERFIKENCGDLSKQHGIQAFLSKKQKEKFAEVVGAVLAKAQNHAVA